MLDEFTHEKRKIYRLPYVGFVNDPCQLFDQNILPNFVGRTIQMQLVCELLPANNNVQWRINRVFTNETWKLFGVKTDWNDTNSIVRVGKFLNIKADNQIGFSEENSKCSNTEKQNATNITQGSSVMPLCSVIDSTNTFTHKLDPNANQDLMQFTSPKKSSTISLEIPSSSEDSGIHTLSEVASSSKYYGIYTHFDLLLMTLTFYSIILIPNLKV